jgi:hypothetical protein
MKAIALIFWMIFTLILVCSVIGMFLFIPMRQYGDREYYCSSWMFIGIKLLDSVTNEK